MAVARTRDEDAAKRILDATRTLVAEHGPSGATISEIASAAGVARQTIYRWWPSRTALVTAALVDMTDAGMPYRATGDLVGDLRHHMRSVAATFAGPAGALIKELVAEAQSDPEAAAAFRSTFFDHRREQARAFFTSATSAGQLDPGEDLDALIYALYSPLWLALLVGHEDLDDDFADRILATHLVDRAPLR